MYQITIFMLTNSDKFGHSRCQEALQKKQAASEQLEENLGAEIRDLQTAVKQKEAALQDRDSEINALKAQTDGLAKQVSGLELSAEHLGTRLDTA